MTTSPLPPGFRASGLCAGIKKKAGIPDLGLLVADEAWPAVAMTTRNQFVGAHIPVLLDHLARSGGLVRAILVNSGNANCATGAQGEAYAREVCDTLAARLGCSPEQVLFLSTGVIGQQLPRGRIEEALPRLLDEASPTGLGAFAEAIRTTDTCAKTASRAISTGKPRSSLVSGAGKGSGMIHPDMATMLAFLLTDAPVAGDLGGTLRRVVDDSFHRLTVDRDTSPNDTVILWSSMRGPGPGTTPGQDAEHEVEDAIRAVAQDLSRQIAADGEGATRLVTIQVRGAATPTEASMVGRFIATSPLVKTAVFGRDPNWGRLLSSACSAGVSVDPAAVRVWIGPAMLYTGGRPHPEREPEAREHLLGSSEVILGVDLGVGSSEAEIWSCDFSPEYVRINADYRT